MAEEHGGYCLICYEELTDDNSFSLGCGHEFCRTCWTEFVTDRIKSGNEGIDTYCMQQGCNMKIGHSHFEELLENDEDTLKKYWTWLVKSMTD